jgi:hypothetical protein
MWLRRDVRHAEVVPAGQHMAPDHSSDRALEADTPVSFPDRHARLRHRVRAIAVAASAGANEEATVPHLPEDLAHVPGHGLAFAAREDAPNLVTSLLRRAWAGRSRLFSALWLPHRASVERRNQQEHLIISRSHRTTVEDSSPSSR